MHDQPHLTFEEDRVVPIGERWPRMVAGTPWVASCTVQIDAERVESCSGPEAAEFLTYGAFGDAGVREFFTHVRFHKHDEDQIVVHLLVELYARSAQEATEVLEEAAEGTLEITSLAEESRPPAPPSFEAPEAASWVASMRAPCDSVAWLIASPEPSPAATAACSSRISASTRSTAWRETSACSSACTTASRAARALRSSSATSSARRVGPDSSATASDL